MRLEIAICTFNRAAQLDRTLEILARQTAEPADWSVLVVDNASTDETAAVVARHAVSGALRGLRRVYEERPGLTSARQRAMCDASAPWVAFVDDDCHLAPDWVRAALAAIAAHPEAGAMGGRVRPVWAAGVGAARRRHGWIFAEQDHGPEAKEVGSLVGTGLILNRAALDATGWTGSPLLQDRIGRGSTSGGDVEISLRLRASGRPLVYDPAMVLDHAVDPARQTVRGMLALSAGLGAGSALVSLLENPGPPAAFFDAERTRDRVERARERRSLVTVLRGQWRLFDWLLFRSFRRGRAAKVRELEQAPDIAAALSGQARPLSS